MGHEEPANARPRSRGWPDAAVARVAARQATMISRAQLRALGISASAIERAVRRGRLYRVHQGVYSVVPAAARPPLAAEHAAILACGPHALLSHRSAATLHGLELDPRSVSDTHVTLLEGRRHSRPGLVVHRPVALHRDDHHRLHGLPVTSAARTVVDLAPELSDAQLAALIDRALRRTSRTKLRAAAARRAGRPGAARVLALIDPTRPSADVWSRAEQRLHAGLKRSGLPLPEANVPVGRYTVDLLWRAERVIVEYDSNEFHSGPAAARWDTARHNDLTAMGYAVIHVTAAELTAAPERVLVQIATALARAA